MQIAEGIEPLWTSVDDDYSTWTILGLAYGHEVEGDGEVRAPCTKEQRLSLRLAPMTLRQELVQRSPRCDRILGMCPEGTVPL